MYIKLNMVFVYVYTYLHYIILKHIYNNLYIHIHIYVYIHKHKYTSAYTKVYTCVCQILVLYRYTITKYHKDLKISFTFYMVHLNIEHILLMVALYIISNGLEPDQFCTFGKRPLPQVVKLPPFLVHRGNQSSLYILNIQLKTCVF